MGCEMRGRRRARQREALAMRDGTAALADTTLTSSRSGASAAGSDVPAWLWHVFASMTGPWSEIEEEQARYHSN